LTKLDYHEITVVCIRWIPADVETRAGYIELCHRVLEIQKKKKKKQWNKVIILYVLTPIKCFHSPSKLLKFPSQEKSYNPKRFTVVINSVSFIKHVQEGRRASRFLIQLIYRNAYLFPSNKNALPQLREIFICWSILFSLTI